MEWKKGDKFVINQDCETWSHISILKGTTGTIIRATPDSDGDILVDFDNGIQGKCFKLRYISRINRTYTFLEACGEIAADHDKVADSAISGYVPIIWDDEKGLCWGYSTGLKPIELNPRWFAETFVLREKPKPQPVEFTEAVKAAKDKKPIWVKHPLHGIRTYAPDTGSNTSLTDNNGAPISVDEILNGTWYIGEPS